jgi:hypothetical protein
MQWRSRSRVSSATFRPHIGSGALAFVLVMAVVAPSPAVAHHAFAADYSVGNPITIKGTVVKFELVNPHSWLYLAVKNSDGTVSYWGIEFGAPFSLNEQGVKKSTFPVGSEVTIYGYRSKSGKNFGYAVGGILPDGHILRNIGGANDAPPPPRPSAPSNPG